MVEIIAFESCPNPLPYGIPDCSLAVQLDVAIQSRKLLETDIAYYTRQITQTQRQEIQDGLVLEAQNLHKLIHTRSE